MCHYFTARTPISLAMGNDRVKGLGGGKKAAKGSSSWEPFLRNNPDRVKK
jgi:crossover junction endodeoxyribonuclease RuvC